MERNKLKLKSQKLRRRNLNILVMIAVVSLLILIATKQCSKTFTPDLEPKMECKCDSPRVQTGIKIALSNFSGEEIDYSANKLYCELSNNVRNDSGINIIYIDTLVPNVYSNSFSNKIKKDSCICTGMVITGLVSNSPLTKGKELLCSFFFENLPASPDTSLCLKQPTQIENLDFVYDEVVCFVNFVLGQARYLEGDFEGAITHFDNFLIENCEGIRSLTSTLFYLGNCYAFLGEYETAQKIYESSLILVPDQEMIKYNLDQLQRFKENKLLSVKPNANTEIVGLTLDFPTTDIKKEKASSKNSKEKLLVQPNEAISEKGTGFPPDQTKFSQKNQPVKKNDSKSEKSYWADKKKWKSIQFSNPEFQLKEYRIAPVDRRISVFFYQPNKSNKLKWINLLFYDKGALLYSGKIKIKKDVTWEKNGLKPIIISRELFLAYPRTTLISATTNLHNDTLTIFTND